MDFHTKIYLCYFDNKYLISCIEKKETNLRMETTILGMLKDIESVMVWQMYFKIILKLKQGLIAMI